MGLEPLTFGSLFAGIGGFDLGFERAGMVCKWQVEIDDYANRVLAKHWPDVARYRDIRECGAHNLEAVDVICGGFPCQDISYAGRGAGLEGERSGLFFEAVRVVRELRPRIVVLENVAALLTRGLDVVLGTLAEIGFDAEWHCIPAAAVGAPHIRDRVFVLAYPAGERRACPQDSICGLSDSGLRTVRETPAEQAGGQDCPRGWGWWDGESGMARVVYGIPARMVDGPNRACGNAVVPQVAEWIGRRIVQSQVFGVEGPPPSRGPNETE